MKYPDGLLRKDHDRRSGTIVKREMLATIDKTKILFLMEDRSRVGEMQRSEGFVWLQCAPGEF